MFNLPESFLALFTGHDRAAAMMGDLTEMAATRGHLWFAAAYVRTLFSLTWRIPVALFVAEIGRELIFNLIHIYISHTPANWRTTDGPFLLNQIGPLLACVMSTFWFALPFAAVLYGVRDRFVRLIFVIAAGTTIAFLFIPIASLLAAAATLALAAAALISKTWRKPFEVLLWTGAAGALAVATTTVLARQFLFSHPVISHALGSHPSAGYLFTFAFQGSLLLVAIVCSRLHRLLLSNHDASQSTHA